LKDKTNKANDNNKKKQLKERELNLDKEKEEEIKKNIKGKNKKKHENDKKATIKRISTIFNIKTKQNQMEKEKIGKQILKRIQNKERPIKKRRSQLNFFLHYFFIKIISFLLFSLIKNQAISYGKIMSIPVDLFLSLFFLSK
jgi:hypothetical protein